MYRNGILEESPGFTGTRYWITSRQGDLTDSVTENKPPDHMRVRSGKGETER